MLIDAHTKKSLLISSKWQKSLNFRQCAIDFFLKHKHQKIVSIWIETIFETKLRHVPKPILFLAGSGDKILWEIKRHCTLDRYLCSRALERSHLCINVCVHSQSSLEKYTLNRNVWYLKTFWLSTRTYIYICLCCGATGGYATARKMASISCLLKG